MSSSISSSSGVLSSSFITTIVNQEEARLQAPITVEQQTVKTDQAQISAIGKVKSALNTLSGSLSSIADPASVSARTATASNTNVAATAAGSATAGSYSLTGIKLAKSQELYSALYGSSNATVGSGNLTFSFTGGQTDTIAISSSQNTLSGIAAAINSANKGVTASVLQTASGARLQLSSTSTGSSQNFTVSGSGGFPA